MHFHRHHFRHYHPLNLSTAQSRWESKTDDDGSRRRRRMMPLLCAIWRHVQSPVVIICHISYQDQIPLPSPFFFKPSTLEVKFVDACNARLSPKRYWREYRMKLVDNWILTFCQPHKVTSGRICGKEIQRDNGRIGCRVEIQRSFNGVRGGG